MNRRETLGLLGLGAAGLTLPVAAQDRAPGRLVDFTAPSTLIDPPRVTVWLPEGYDAGKRRYGVLYMADGQNLFDPANAYLGRIWGVDRALTRLAVAGTIDPVIVVGIWNAGKDRFRQYMPAAPTDRIAGVRAGIEKAIGGPILSDAWLDFLVHELKPRIDRDYRTRPGFAHTAIAGSSMGGLISLYAIDRFPKVFSRAACVSTHWPVLLPEGDAAPKMQAEITAMWTGWLKATLGAPAGRRIWFDHGDQTLDRFYAPYQAAVDRALADLGWREGRDVVSRTYPGAAHDEPSWAKRLDAVLGWTLATS